MTIESGPESIPQKVLDLVTEVLGPTASLVSMDAEHLWLQVHFTVYEQPIVLDIGFSHTDAATGDVKYKFIKLAIPDCKNLFVQADWKDRFCDWGMEFERGRLLMLYTRLQGLLASPSPQAPIIATDYPLGANWSESDADVAQPGYVLQSPSEALDPSLSDSISSPSVGPISRTNWNQFAVRASLFVCFAFAGAATADQLLKKTSRQVITVPTVPLATPTLSVRPTLVPQPTVFSSQPASPSGCLTVTASATGAEHGLLPWLRAMRHDHPAFFANNHVTPQALVIATIRPRHRAEAAAHTTTSAIHALGEQHHYHFGQVLLGDQVFLQACPRSPVTMSYSRGALHLYTAQVDR